MLRALFLASAATVALLPVAGFAAPLACPAGARPPLALTFDDGPGKNTKYILSELSRVGANATFFLVGKNAVSMPKQMSAILNQGSEIGVHTWSHADLGKLSVDQADREVSKGYHAIVDRVPATVNWWRPPYGAQPHAGFTAGSDLGMRLAMWTLDSLDWQNPSPQALLSFITRSARPGDVVLVHEQSRATLQALPALLDDLSSRFDLVTLDGLHAHPCMPSRYPRAMNRPTGKSTGSGGSAKKAVSSP